MFVSEPIIAVSQKEYDEPMPGLLYEAELPAGPSRRPRRDHHGSSRRHRPRQQQPSDAVEQIRQHPEAEQRQHPEQGQHAAGVSGGRDPGASAAGLPRFPDQFFAGEGGEAERTEDGEREQEREAEMTETTVEGTAATAEEETGAKGATSTRVLSEPRPLETSASVAPPSAAVFELVDTARGGERERSPAYSPSSSVLVPDGTTRERSPASRGIVATTAGARRRRPVSLNNDGATVGGQDEEDVLLMREAGERGSRVDFSTAQDDDHEGVSIKLVSTFQAHPESDTCTFFSTVRYSIPGDDVCGDRSPGADTPVGGRTVCQDGVEDIICR